MKKFATLQQLISYCGYCSACDDFSRKIDLSIGPEDYIKLENYRKIDRTIHINLENGGGNVKEKHKILIDAVTGEVNHSLVSRDHSIYNDRVDYLGMSSSRYRESYLPLNGFYMYYFSSCMKCLSTANTGYIRVDLVSNMVDIGTVLLDDESFRFYDDDNDLAYDVTSFYNNGKMTISLPKPGSMKVDNRDPKIVTCPLFEIDFKNKEKTLKRLKTIVVFS